MQGAGAVQRPTARSAYFIALLETVLTAVRECVRGICVCNVKAAVH